MISILTENSGIFNIEDLIVKNKFRCLSLKNRKIVSKINSLCNNFSHTISVQKLTWSIVKGVNQKSAQLFCTFDNFEVSFYDHENFEHDDCPRGGVRKEESGAVRLLRGAQRARIVSDQHVNAWWFALTILRLEQTVKIDLP